MVCRPGVRPSIRPPHFPSPLFFKGAVRADNFRKEKERERVQSAADCTVKMSSWCIRTTGAATSGETQVFIPLATP